MIHRCVCHFYTEIDAAFLVRCVKLKTTYSVCLSEKYSNHAIELSTRIKHVQHLSANEQYNDVVVFLAQFTVRNFTASKYHIYQNQFPAATNQIK